MNLQRMRFFARTIVAVLVLQLFAPQFSLYAAGPRPANHPLTYKEIGDAYLPSFGVVEQFVEQKPEEKFDIKKFNFQIPRLSDHDARQGMYSLFARNEKPAEVTDFDHRAMHILLKDLEFFFGSGKSSADNVFNRLVRSNVVTFSGETMLAKMFASPTTNVEVLKKRQKAIQAFVDSEELCAQAEKLLVEVKDAEPAFLSFWLTQDALAKEFQKRVYFNKSYLRTANGNPVILEALTRWSNLNTVVWKMGGDLMVTTAITHLIRWLNAKMTNNPRPSVWSTFESIKDGVKSLAKTDWRMVKTYWNGDSHSAAVQQATNNGQNILNDQQIQDLAQRLRIEPEDVRMYAFSNEPISSIKRTILILLGIQLAIGSIIALRQYSVISRGFAEARIDRDCINFIQSRLIAAAPIVRNAESLLTISESNKSLYEGWRGAPALHDLFARAETPQTTYENLIADLQTKTFEGEASFFSFSGRVLASFTRMNECKEEFASLLEAIGELDAYLSIAKLIKQYRNERVHFNFVNFIEGSAKPQVKMTGFWHPILDVATVVKNDIQFGGTVPADILLTGSNTGGKSTILKAMMICMLMAQTFGVAPADTTDITPYFYLGCSMRINDDVAAGTSLFKAEVLRAQSIVERVSSLAPHQFGFIIIDELFTGTAAEKGQEAASKVAQHLLNLAPVNFVFATHYAMLTGLEKEHPAAIANYKIDVLKDANGNIVRPYKIEPGISTINIANDILQAQINEVSFV